jgi:hypothetical protein
MAAALCTMMCYRQVRRSMMDHGGAAPARTGLPLVDADATVSALFGGADVSCAVAANAGFCGFPIIASVCPLSCSDYVGVPENFGEADDEAMLVDLFANLYEPGVMQGSFGVESCSSLADPEVEAYVTINTNGNVYIGCDEPGIAIACPVTCGTNFMCAGPPTHPHSAACSLGAPHSRERARCGHDGARRSVRRPRQL